MSWAALAHGDSALEPCRITLCPNCGSDDYRSNHLDLAPYRDVVCRAKALRALGQFEDADDLLMRWACVKLTNYLRRNYPYRCETCGSQFSE